MERRALLIELIRPDNRFPIQFSDHFEGDGAAFFKAAAEIGLEGIISKQAASRYRSGPSRSWLKTKNMVESEFTLIGTDRDASGIPWALLARDQDGALEFAGPAVLRTPSHSRAEWADKFAAMSIDKPALKGMRRGKAQWLKRRSASGLNT
jgi:bifunctional non-homologous end joining protein LigD